MTSLKLKLLTGFSILIMVTFSLLMLVIHNQIREVNIPLTEDLSQEIIDAKAEKIGTWLYQRVGELKVLGENPIVMSMDMSIIIPYIQQFEKSHFNEFESFGISDLSGNKWISQGVFVDVSKRYYFQHISNDDVEFYISDPIHSKSNDEPIVVIIHKIRNLEGQCVGFIDGAVKISKLAEIASEVQMHDGIGWLADGEGRVFANCNEPYETIKTLEARGFKNIDGAITAMSRGESGIHKIIKKDGAPARLINAPIPYTDSWSLGIIMSEALVYKETNNLLIIIFTFGIIMLVACLIFTVLFANNITKPIKYLQGLMKKAEEGNLSVRFNGKQVDEIGQLGHSFNSMILKIDSLMNKIYQEQKSKRKAELLALQAQIKPHFLYNTLDTIKWMALEHHAKDVADMVKALTQLFQISLSKGKEIITLEEEIKHIEQYLFIQKTRYEDKLNYSITCEEQLLKIPIIKLILQPIVENAIYHGIKPKDTQGNIHIACYREKETMVLQVSDDGVGFDGDYLQNKKKDGYGLANIEERIFLLYGKDYGLKLTSQVNKGTVVKVYLPLSKEGDRIAKDTYS